MLLKNGNVFDGELFQEGLEVRVNGGIITETGYDLQAADGEKIIDLEGDHLLPGNCSGSAWPDSARRP